jgi:hypothetical protein
LTRAFSIAAERPVITTRFEIPEVTPEIREALFRVSVRERLGLSTPRSAGK